MAMRSSVQLVCRRASSTSFPSAPIKKGDPTLDSDLPVPKALTHHLQRQPRRNPCITNESFEAPGYHDFTLHRLYDYFKIGQYVRALEKPMERINFVNPYERNWERTERKWHRANHPNFHAPRKAWALAPTPRYFDIERFYSFITHTRLPTDEHGVLLDATERKKLWSECYKSLNFPHENFEKRVTESLIIALDGRTEFDQESSDKFLTQFVDHGQATLSHSYNFVDQRVSYNPRCESFWICAGFEELYIKEDEFTGELITDRLHFKKYTGDHRQKLGELAFTMRDKLVAQIRQCNPLTSIDLEQSPFDAAFQNELAGEGPFLRPWIYNLDRDTEPLWQCPGYDADSGEQHPYGRVAIKNVFSINERIEWWGIKDTEEIRKTRSECLRATAISTLFNWLNGQAHCVGHTQYTDDGTINYSSQLVLADGREFFFAVGQLRSICFNINWDLIGKSNPDRVNTFPERRPNRLLFEGPYTLFDEYDPETSTFKYKDETTQEMKNGLNPIVLQYFLNMLALK